MNHLRNQILTETTVASMLSAIRHGKTHEEASQFAKDSTAEVARNISNLIRGNTSANNENDITSNLIPSLQSSSHGSRSSYIIQFHRYQAILSQ